MTQHPTDESELTEPLDLRVLDLEPYHPRDALRLEMQARRDGFMVLAGEAHSELARAEYLEYAEQLEGVMRHIDRWDAFYKESDNG